MSLFSGIRKKLESFGNRAIAQIDRNDGGRTAFNYNQQRFTQPQRPQPRPVAQQPSRNYVGFQQQIRSGKAPSYGSGLSGLTNRFRDIADANTAQDRFKRDLASYNTLSPSKAAPMNELYTDQQKRMGNARPLDNLGQQVFGNTARLVNTAESGRRAYQSLPGLAKESVFGTDKSYQQRLNQIDRRLDSDEKTDSGILRAGTVFDKPGQSKNISAKDLTKKFVGTGAGVYGEISPVAAGKVYKGTNLGLKVLARTGVGGTEAAFGSAGSQLATNGKIDAKQTAIDTLFGIGLANTAPVVSNITKKTVQSLPSVAKKGVAVAKAADSKLMENPRTRGIEDTINTKKLLYDNASPSQRNILNKEIAQLRQEANAIKSGGGGRLPIVDKLDEKINGKSVDPLESLKAEARKYKSADEFVKSDLVNKNKFDGLDTEEYSPTIADVIANKSVSRKGMVFENGFDPYRASVDPKKLLSPNAEVKNGKVRIYRISEEGGIKPGDYITDNPKYIYGDESFLVNKDGMMGVYKRQGVSNPRVDEAWVSVEDVVNPDADLVLAGKASGKPGEFYYVPKNFTKDSLTDLYNQATQSQPPKSPIESLKQEATPKYMQDKVTPEGYFTEGRYKDSAYPKNFVAKADIPHTGIKAGDRVALIKGRDGRFDAILSKKYKEKSTGYTISRESFVDPKSFTSSTKGTSPELVPTPVKQTAKGNNTPIKGTQSQPPKSTPKTVEAKPKVTAKQTLPTQPKPRVETSFDGYVAPKSDVVNPEAPDFLQVSKTPTVKSKPSITAIASEKPSVVAKAPLVEGQNAVRLGSGFDSELVPAKFPTDINVRNGVGTQIKTALVEKDNPLIKTLSQVEKKTGKKGIVDQFLYDSGLASRSDSIANVKLNNNANLKSALSGLSKKELKTFNDYAAARSELYNASRGLKTSRPVGELQAVVDTLGGQHAKRFDDLNKFYKDYAKDLYDGGVIDKAKYDQFIASPDYIRTQRDMADVVGARGSGGRGYSLKTTLTSKKRVGSSRELLPADRTAFDYAQKAQGEIQRNQVASNLVDSLEGTSLIRKADQGELLTNKNTIGRFKNGVRETYIVDPEIKQVIDNVAPFQLNTLEKIVAAPKRIFQAGTTGLSAPFTLANYVKDQLTSGINSKSIIDTHNPANIVAGLWEATKEFAGAKNSDSWERFAAHAGDTTQYDLLRGAKNANQLSRELRNGFGGKVVNRITSPIKTLEDLVSITEKATRYQSFRGMEGKLLKQTGNRADALREASLAAWQNSVDFNRYGDWGKTLNLLIPYFNSGIQGSRQLVRSFKNRPLATSVKTLGTVGLPLIGMTAWNMQTPERKAVYDNISDFEKENNFIVIPPGPLGQNQDGTYNVWKVPMPQGYSNLITPMRRAMESFANKSPQDWANISQDLLGAVSGPINTNSAQQAVAGLMPQAAKPLVQQAANKDFFTNKAIVPDYVNEATDASGQPIPENKKAFNYTSGSAQMLGDAINQSPIRIEKFFKDTFGKTGQYGTNALDNALAKLGVIKPNQIGGVSVKDDISRRFTKAQGEYNNNKSAGGKYYDSVKQATANLNTNERSAYNALHPSKTNFTGEEIFDENKRLTKYARAGLYLQFPKVFAADKALNDAQARQGSPSNPLYDLPKDQLTRVLLKATLPPGSKDPELSNLYDKEWYQDYNAKRSKYYNDMKAKLAKEGKKMPKSDNPYPDTPANLQKTMDTYSALPKGTGARSSWIKANGPSFELMKQQWANIDAWENKERVALGLSPIANEQSSSYASGSGYGGGYGGGGGGGQSDSNPNKYAISRTAGGSIKLKSTIKKPKVVARIASPPVNTGKGKGKLVKSKV